jgi:hypothetical protein
VNADKESTNRKNAGGETFAGGHGTPHGENFTTNVGQRPTGLRKSLSLPAHYRQSKGPGTAHGPVRAADVRPPIEFHGPEREMPDAIGRLAARRKTILIAWDEPSASWSKQVEIKK